MAGLVPGIHAFLFFAFAPPTRRWRRRPFARFRLNKPIPLSQLLAAGPKPRGGRMNSLKYPDLHAHIAALQKQGLLFRVKRPINKDTEMHALVRWQFRGGIPEAERKAFLFTNIVDSKGRKYDIPVIVGGIAANPEIYRIGMNVPTLADIGDAWNHAIDHPVPPV